MKKSDISDILKEGNTIKDSDGNTYTKLDNGKILVLSNGRSYTRSMSEAKNGIMASNTLTIE